MKILIDVIVLLMIYFFKCYKKWKEKGKDILFIYTTLYIYLSFVLYFTLMPVVTSLPFLFNHPYRPMNLEPFIDVSLGRGDFLRQVGLNVLMTIPFGFLFPLTKSENAKFSKTILMCFLLSFSIEIIQPLISGSRSSDITDIITNVFGGMIGYGFYLLFKPLTMKIVKWIRGH